MLTAKIASTQITSAMNEDATRGADFAGRFAAFS